MKKAKIERAVGSEKAKAGDLWYRLHHQVWVPNTETIARIWTTVCAEQPKGGIVCAVFELLDPEGSGPWGLGWDGKSQVFRLQPEKAAWFAANLEKLSPGDPAILWLRTPRFGRTLLFGHGGTLCLNFTPGKGYEVAEGTLDQEWMQ
jgi:hypothetical protein